MAHWIDRAALWAFAAAAAYLLALSVTDGQMILSALIAFMGVYLLRLVLKRLPERRMFLIGERRRYIHSLLTRWAVMQPDQTQRALHSVLPDLLSAKEWKQVRLVQHLPESVLRAEEMLTLRRGCGEEEVVFVCTCPAADEARALLSSLPPCRLIDSRQLSRMLMKVIRDIPAEEAKKERRQPLRARIAPYIRSVRPIRTGVYAVLFAVLYLMARRTAYLMAAAVLFALVLIRLLSEINSGRID